MNIALIIAGVDGAMSTGQALGPLGLILVLSVLFIRFPRVCICGSFNDYQLYYSGEQDIVEFR